MATCVLDPAVVELVEETPYRGRIEPRRAMQVPGVVFASRALLPEASGDQALQQVANVATLPGIVTASYAMPDVHGGYGFPIGGVRDRGLQQVGTATVDV